MILSKAELQKRHRVKLRVAARTEALAEQTHALMGSVVEIAAAHGYVDDAATNPMRVDDYLAWMHTPEFHHNNWPPFEAMEQFVRELSRAEEIADREREIVARASAVLDALILKPALAQ